MYIYIIFHDNISSLFFEKWYNGKEISKFRDKTISRSGVGSFTLKARPFVQGSFSMHEGQFDF